MLCPGLCGRAEAGRSLALHPLGYLAPLTCLRCPTALPQALPVGPVGAWPAAAGALLARLQKASQPLHEAKCCTYWALPMARVGATPAGPEPGTRDRAGCESHHASQARASPRGSAFGRVSRSRRDPEIEPHAVAADEKWCLSGCELIAHSLLTKCYRSRYINSPLESHYHFHTALRSLP